MGCTRQDGKVWMAMRRGILAVIFSAFFIAGCGGGGGTTPITNPTAATPALSPAPGAFTSVQSVTLTDTTAGASIYYTTNGTTPTTASTLYSASAPIAVSSTTTIEAIAVASGYTNSAVASGTYTIRLPAAAAPTFSPAPGSYTSEQPVSLLDATNGASIYYTTNGSTPTTSSTLYSASAPIAVSSTTTIEAIAVAPGYSTSAVATPGAKALAGAIRFDRVGLTAAFGSTAPDRLAQRKRGQRSPTLVSWRRAANDGNRLIGLKNAPFRTRRRTPFVSPKRAILAKTIVLHFVQF